MSAFQKDENRSKFLRFGLPAVVAAVGAGVLAMTLLGGTPDPEKTPVTTETVALELASYEGKQPEGFTIDKVPAGWELQASTEYNLLLAPEGFANQDPNQFEGKIMIGLANELELSADRGETHELKVGDATGTRFSFATDFKDGKSVYGPDAAPGLLLPDGKKSLIFQFPENLDWNDATIAEFAEGIHLTGDAVAGAG